MKVKQVHPKLMTWAESVLSAEECGFLANVQRLDDTAFSADFPEHGPLACGRELARNLPGFCVVSPGPLGGISWVNGRNGPHGNIVRSATVAKVKSSREIVEAVTGLKPKWSVGGNARQLLTWIGPPQDYSRAHERLLWDISPEFNDGKRPIPYGYHECSPGLYPCGEYHDVSGYYYDMFCRLPSLYVGEVTKTRITFLPMDADTTARWYAVKDAVRHDKSIRNTLAGCAAGSVRSSDERPLMAFSRNKETGGTKCYRLPQRPGPFRAVGLLMVRTGVELTLAQCAYLGGECVYSNVDCTITTTKQSMGIWLYHGFRVPPPTTGATEVCHRGSWCVGVRHTAPYHDGDREYITRERGTMPKTLYHRQWL